MVSLFGTQLSRSDLMTRVGDISQVAGIRMGELSDGPGRGVRTADFRTGSGLAFTVLLDRGMDILWASYRDIPLAWCSSIGPMAPAFHEPAGGGWLRGFAGGLLVTCGLTHYGPAVQDGAEALGAHGRASFIPAGQISRGEGWQGEQYEMWIEGEVRQAVTFGENLVLRRRISAKLGESRLHVDDTVTNQGFATTPLMLLYHCNFGYPILSENSELLIQSEVTARDEIAATALPEHRRFQPPTPGFEAAVFFHKPQVDSDGRANAAMVNRTLSGGEGLGVYMRFPVDTLPYLAEWKLMEQGHYVCGLEPGTNMGYGRPTEREAGRLRYLEPGESRRFSVEIGMLESKAAIDSFAAAYA